MEREDYKFGNIDERIGKVKLLYRINELMEYCLWLSLRYGSIPRKTPAPPIL
jgi:hypothetical protein